MRRDFGHGSAVTEASFAMEAASHIDAGGGRGARPDDADDVQVGK